MYIYNRSQRRKVTNRYKRKRMSIAHSLGDNYPYDVIKERKDVISDSRQLKQAIKVPCPPYLKYYGFSKKFYKRQSNKVWRNHFKQQLSNMDIENIQHDNHKRLYSMMRNAG